MAERVQDVRRVLDAVDAAARAGLHAVGFVSYDAVPALDSALVVREAAPLPMAWFGLFDEPSSVDEAALPAPAAAQQWTLDVQRLEYDAAIAEIRHGIARGDYYQVNHTFRLHARDVEPFALWQQLRRAQRGAYCAFIDTGRHVIASASPELFFERDGRHIVMRPMKGTAPRGRWLEEDDARVAALAGSEKERAENLMIVDLVRNDLGRVAELGTVRVEKLCEVERWPTVLQMTSTVTARLRAETTTAQLFEALFPCGSVTGAPKVAAMRAIARLETSPRGVYCGAIGQVSPGGGGRATFNVAIRTAWIDRERGVAEYGVGGGITWDSTAGDEFGEAMAKARVLTEAVAEFELVETMRLQHGTYVRLEQHLRRLARSATYFGFADPTEAARSVLERERERQGRAGVWRVRLLAGRGSVRVEVGAMPKLASVTAVLAKEPVSSNDRFLFHKTTLKQRPRDRIELLWNERGELTEFSIGNLVLEIDGSKWTPRVSAGLLPGVFREELLERGEVRERVLVEADLERASGVWLINSVREWVALSDVAGTCAVRAARA